MKIVKSALAKPVRDWNWAVEGAVLLFILAGAFAMAPLIAAGGWTWSSGALMGAAALVEATISAKNAGTPEGETARILSRFTLFAALIHLLAALAQALQLGFLVSLALLCRGAGAILAGVRVKARGRVWIAGRGCIDIALGGMLLIILPLATAITLPLTTVLSLVSSADARPLPAPGFFLAISTAVAAMAYLAAGLGGRSKQP